MKKIYSVSGLHCNACVNRVQKALGSLPGVEQVTVDLSAASAEIKAGRLYDTEYLNSVLEDYGDYSLSEKE